MHPRHNRLRECLRCFLRQVVPNADLDQHVHTCAKIFSRKQPVRLASFGPKRSDNVGAARSRIESTDHCLIDHKLLHQHHRIGCQRRRLRVTNCIAREKTGGAKTTHIRNDHSIAFRRQQRSYVNKAVDVVSAATRGNFLHEIRSRDFRLLKASRLRYSKLKRLIVAIRPRLCTTARATAVRYVWSKLGSGSDNSRAECACQSSRFLSTRTNPLELVLLR